MRRLGACALLAAGVAGAAGCNSPYRADQGAVVGGLTGAGVGALVGNAVGNTGAGAAIGAGVGALSGAAVGGSLDEIEARNRAEIERRLGRQVAASAVTVSDVVEMTRAGVAEELIINHVRVHGVAAPLAVNDLVYLQKQNVSTRVIETMQNPPVRVAQAVAPAPVIVEEHVWGGPYWGPPPYFHHRHCYPRHGVHWGVSFGH
jgi:outer membrane lipoprotein SlyB